MTNLIEVNGLCKNYKDFSLNNVGFSLEPGCIMGFVGPNGAGKSTTIKLLLNLINRDGGNVKLFGLDNIQDEIAVKQQIGFVLDDLEFHESMTAKQAGWMLAGFYENWDQTLFDGYLDKFSLPPEKKIKAYSTGMKAKLSIALALSHHAKLLILDEPTTGLDPVVRSDILGELFKVVEDPECSVFFSTHITSDLDKVADYVTFINNGRIILSTSKDKINENYSVVKGTKGQLEDVRGQLLSYNENPFGFDGLTNDTAALRRRFGDKLVFEKAKIEDILLYFEKGALSC